MRSWLVARTGDADLDVSPLVVPAHGGLSADTLLAEVRWSAPGPDPHGARPPGVAVRLEPAPPTLFPDPDLAREARVLAAVAACGAAPVPAVVGHEPDPGVLGRAFLVTELVPGRIPSDDPPYQLGGWLHDAEPAEQRRVQASVVEAMGALHRCDPSPLSAALRVAPDGRGLDRELARWRTYLDWVADEDGPLPVLEAAWAWCAEHRPAVDRVPADAPNWGDARFGNAVVGGGGAVAALLDWEMATVAPPEVDLGWFCFLHATALAFLPELPGFEGRAAMLARWAAVTGREAEDLTWYEVFAGVRAAAIQARLAVRAGAPERARHDPAVMVRLRTLLPELPPPPSA